MNNHRVKAYTIMEVTITMLVSAILIGITYSAYSIISKSYGSFNRNNVEIAALARLDHLLCKDFAGAEIVLKDTDGISVSYTDHTVKYQFGPDFIVRTYLRADTFKFNTETVIMGFEDQALTELAPTSEQNRLDDLQLTILFRDEKIPYHYYKQYSSVNLVKRNEHAVN